MQPPSVRLVYPGHSSHIQQLLTGFSFLDKKKTISLSQSIFPVDDLPDQRRLLGSSAYLVADINGSHCVVYDARDGWIVNRDLLKNCDLYFKRSWVSKEIAKLGMDGKRVLPLGLNYLVYPDRFDLNAFKRTLNPGLPKNRLRNLLAVFPLLDRIRFVPRASAMSQRPAANPDPRIIFMTGTWDPAALPTHRVESIAERRYINDMRAGCIRELQKAFGERFCGGFIPTFHARATYPDLLFPSMKQTAKRRYIQTLRSCDIGVATQGLHGSVGWKLAEYVAFSKAIVSEPLPCKLPGNFDSGKNYLEFTTPRECVAQVGRLLHDSGLHHAMRQANAAYYDTYLRPDRLVLNSLRRIVPDIG